MMKFKVIFTVIALALSLQSFAGAKVESMGKEKVVNILQSQMSPAQANALAEKMYEEFGKRNVEVKGFFKRSKGNLAFFRDTDKFNVDLTILDGGDSVVIPNAVYAVLNNGGLTMEITYKWMFFFVVGDDKFSLQDLEGAVFGRGLGIDLDVGIGLEVSYLPGKGKTAGGIFMITPKIGVGGGLHFPKITFKSRL